MSDHLCSMNETLSKQREEIDTLKLGSKVQHLDFCYVCFNPFFIRALVKNVAFWNVCLPLRFVFSCHFLSLHMNKSKRSVATEEWLNIKWLQGVWSIFSGLAVKWDVVKFSVSYEVSWEVVGGVVFAAVPDGKNTCPNHLKKSLSWSGRNGEACSKRACSCVYAHRRPHVG